MDQLAAVGLAIHTNITGRPVWGQTLERNAFTRISTDEYAVQMRLRAPGDGKVTLKARRTKQQYTAGPGKRVIAVSVKNRTGTKIAVRFRGPNGHNNIMRTDFRENNRDDAFDADGWRERWDTLCSTCFYEIRLYRAGCFGFMDVIDGGIMNTPGLKDLIDQGFNEVELVWT
ncbi:hypothetical protein HDU96_004443 [Phlyctochytrium bullatum]|nr:hypothetical protein HDU96_004443 [Phlyctochytrium bullatum]